MAKARTTHRHAAVRLKSQELQRIGWAQAAIGVCGALVAARVVQLQVFQHDSLHEAGMRRRLRRRPLLAKRGAILDRNGKPLAQSQICCHIAIDPTTVRAPEVVARILARRLGGNPAEMRAQILQAQQSGRRYLRIAASAPIERYRALQTDLESAFRHLKRDERPALTREHTPTRAYPQGSIAPQVIGLTQLRESREEGNTLIAVSGVEKRYDAVLAGKNGVEEGEIAPGGLIIPETLRRRELPTDGESVRLTLDTDVQKAAENALEQLWCKHRPKGALIIVMDPHTGDLLAVANRPTFDLATRKGLTAPRNDTPAERDRAMEPLRNRAVEFLYEPGSTIKPLVVAALLAEGAISLTSRYHCQGAMRVGGKSIRCVVHGRGKGHGHQTLEDALSHSCNVAMAQMGLRAGLEGVYRALQRFKLFEPLEAGFAGEQVGRTIPPEDVRWGRELRATNLAFGQGLMVSPLALVAAYGALANEGRWIAPRIVLEPAPVRRDPQPIVPVEHTRLVIRGLVQAVEEGTGKNAQLKGYWVAGKTGTAQKAIEGGRGYAPGKYIASFVGIVPADAPRAVILALADEPQNGYYGGEVAAPAFRQVAQFLMWHWRIPPSRREGVRAQPALFNPRTRAG
ncbi:MAG: penicillin-binding protein 2 [Fimbriimonadales bacterium]|nr:MAG: stage V sporulation protein D [Fimbriimonadales bacterium]